MKKLIVVFPDMDNLNFLDAYFIRNAIVADGRPAVKIALTDQQIVKACTDYKGYIEGHWEE